MEIWRPIPGYEGIAEASSEGRIRTLDRIGGGPERGGYRLTGRIRSIRPRSGTGPATVTLNKNGERECRTASVWVWAAFSGRMPERGEAVYHRDGNSNNHRPDNLAVGPYSKAFVTFAVRAAQRTGVEPPKATVGKRGQPGRDTRVTHRVGASRPAPSEPPCP